MHDDIERALIRDRQRLRQRLSSIQQIKDHAQRETAQRSWQQQLDASIDGARRRAAGKPRVDFSQDLPILTRREEIADAIRNHQVVVVSGETGSGKSTQLPKICLDAGFGTYGMIGHTQPRRIAARTIAARLADELETNLGEAVGFKIRFTDKTDNRTYIKLMTDGILLAETQGDRWLEQYEVLIIDEAHERSLNIDFLLGLLYQVLPRRPELRVIITSATIDAKRFAAHFGTDECPAPAIEVSGRTYPVEVRYRPLVGDQDETDEVTGIVQAVEELAEIDRGHVLVFLPTERDIRETAKRLRTLRFPGDGPQSTEVLPLYARLSNKEQNRVFQPYAGRRIVLATNVAESSLTVPGIRYVVDTGTARISRYAPRSKVQRLPIEPVSRASADQRKGRCGRVADGVCIRLYDEADYEGRSSFTTPEIQRTNLAAVILRAKALNLGRVEDFPFIDPPRAEAIRDGYRTLFELGAVDEQGALTDLGRRLSRFPVDPRIARIILAGHENGCLADVLIIAAALEMQDPRDRPLERQQQADEAHAQFADEDSDFLSYLRIWDFYHELKERLSWNQLRRGCLQNFLNYNRMREWTEIHRQLLQLVATHKLHVDSRSENYENIHTALLTGFLSGVAYRSGDHEYTGAGGVKFHLWPGSSQFETKPNWCLVAELVETRRRYGRTVAGIKTQWIEPLAEHLVKRRYNDPHWHRKSGRVMAWESVTLFGLPIILRRRVPYGPIDPQLASEVFLRDGLAKRALDCDDKFYRHNEQVIEECLLLAAKTRQSDYLVDEYGLYRFYNERLPSDVFDLASLRKWIKDDPSHRNSIQLSVDNLIPSDPQTAAERFPNELPVGTLKLPLSYAFAPGDENDGATLTVPEDGLAQIEAGQAEWGVPGFLEEKITGMIRSLPKSIRRGLIPAPDTAQRVASALTFGQGDFFEQTIACLSEIAGEPISKDAFRLEKLAPHLRVNYRVVDSTGQMITEGRDLTAIRESLGVEQAVEVDLEDGDDRWNRDRINAWDFGELPPRISISRNNIEIAAFPTLSDGGETVQLRLLSSADLSRRETRAGVRRLYAINKRKALRSQVSWLPRFDEICVLAQPVVSPAALTSQVHDLIADRAFFRRGEKLPRNEAEFAARLENSAERIGMATQDVAKLLPKLFDAYHAARLAIEQYASPKGDHALRDVRGQLAALLGENFLLRAPWMWLSCYPRYLHAIAYRMERLPAGAGDRDRAATAEIADYWQRYQQRSAALAAEHRADDELETYRWMIEEYRVSKFAQPLGTSITVSAPRLDKQWSKVGAS